MEIRGTFFNFQKFSIHDGPGIRTVVFFKGCPLRCGWCSNPESQAPGFQVLWNTAQCVRCLQCFHACPAGAVSVGGAGADGEGAFSDRLLFSRERCTGCGICVSACPGQALSLAGKGYTVEEVMEVCLEDQVFYEESGGGVTLSGGEALAQGEFAETLLVRLGEAGIHRAIETSGYAAPETFARIAARTDLLFFDLKHPDPARHLAGTGVAQEPILENFRAALRASRPGSAVGTCAVGENAVGESARRLQVLPRIPVIPGYNDSLPDADAFTELLLNAGAREVQLLPFHQFGQNKYKLLGLDYGLAKEKALHPEDLEPYRARFEKQGIRAFF